jgi:hypothetical protein
MGPLDAQLQRLAERHPGATWEDRGAHGLLVTIPHFALPAGWNKHVTQVKFLVPQGYPYSRPDCFWADGDLRVQGQSAPPQATQNNAIVPDAVGMVWFSWHLTQWNPNRDDLFSWIACVRDRLQKVA